MKINGANRPTYTVDPMYITKYPREIVVVVVLVFIYPLRW